MEHRENDESIDGIEFAGTRVSIIRERQVQDHLSLHNAIDDLREAFRAYAQQQAVSAPRIRIVSPQQPWLHTLRAGIPSWNVIGGKDYTSVGFNTPAMWVTVVDGKTALPKAFIEANYLSRIRTAAATGLATELLAPRDATCLAHFGAGKISELLVRAVLEVRPSVRRVLLVRHDDSKGAPDWLDDLGDHVKAKLVTPETALREAHIMTTATNSARPVIPVNAEMPNVRHVNLVGANHLKRREVPEDFAYRCLPPTGYLVVEDTQQARQEAGDFAALGDKINWNEIPTLGQFIDDPDEKKKADNASLTVFKSVGIGLMDLAVAAGVLRRMKLLAPFGSENTRRT